MQNIADVLLLLREFASCTMYTCMVNGVYHYGYMMKIRDTLICLENFKQLTTLADHLVDWGGDTASYFLPHAFSISDLGISVPQRLDRDCAPVYFSA